MGTSTCYLRSLQARDVEYSTIIALNGDSSSSRFRASTDSLGNDRLSECAPGGPGNEHDFGASHR